MDSTKCKNNTVIRHTKFTKGEPYGNHSNIKWRILPLVSYFKHKHTAVKPPPFTDIHTKWLNIPFGTPASVDWDLTEHRMKQSHQMDGWTLQNFLLSHYLPLSAHSHTRLRERWFRLSFTRRNTFSWNRAGIICLELSMSSWMSPGFVKHGSGFSFYFPQWTVKCFLTDGGCMTCCHNKINSIPWKTSLSDFIFPDGKKQTNFWN